MSILKTCALCAFFFIGQLWPAAAQSTAGDAMQDQQKPLLFSDLPDSVLIDYSRLNQLLSQSTHTNIRIEFSPTFALQGNIVSTARSEQPQLSSLVLKASNRLGAVFTLTRIVEPSGSVAYSGRILSRGHADAFEVVEAKGNVYLIKRKFNDLQEE